MTNAVAALGTTIRYEALLATRRRAVWLALLPLSALIMLLTEFPRGRSDSDPITGIGDTALLIGFLGSIGIAMVLADALATQREPGLYELFGAMPGGSRSRSAGVVLGPWLVAVLPFGLILLAMGVWHTASGAGPRALAASAIGLLTIVLPGSLLLTVLANVLALVVPGAVARISIVPLWYWATALSPLIPIPTVARTPLSPLGDYQAAQWLRVALPQAGGGWPHPAVSPATAVAALGITLAATALTFLAGDRLPVRRG